MGFEDHDRFVAKNRSLAVAEEIGRREAELAIKGSAYIREQRDSSCFNCKMKKSCREFNARTRGGTTGVASFGGNERLICDKYEAAESANKSMSDKQVKSLMKGFKRGY